MSRPLTGEADWRAALALWFGRSSLDSSNCPGVSGGVFDVALWGEVWATGWANSWITRRVIHQVVHAVSTR